MPFYGGHINTKKCICSSWTSCILADNPDSYRFFLDHYDNHIVVSISVSNSDLNF